MKVTQAIGSESETYSEIDLELPEGTPEKLKKRIKKDVGDYLVEQVLSTVAEAKSPVKGENFKPLSKDYKKKKLAEGGTGKPDMTEHGDMMDDCTFRVGNDDLIKLGFFSSEAWKADGHLKFSGAEGTAPKRRFLPGEGQAFKGSIEGEVEKIIADATVDIAAPPKSAFAGVQTTSELYQALRDLFPSLGRAEIRAAVLRSAILSELLDELDLLDMLE